MRLPSILVLIICDLAGIGWVRAVACVSSVLAHGRLQGICDRRRRRCSRHPATGACVQHPYLRARRGRRVHGDYAGLAAGGRAAPQLHDVRQGLCDPRHLRPGEHTHHANLAAAPHNPGFLAVILPASPGMRSFHPHKCHLCGWIERIPGLPIFCSSLRTSFERAAERLFCNPQ